MTFVTHGLQIVDGARPNLKKMVALVGYGEGLYSFVNENSICVYVHIKKQCTPEPHRIWATTSTILFPASASLVLCCVVSSASSYMEKGTYLPVVSLFAAIPFLTPAVTQRGGIAACSNSSRSVSLECQFCLGGNVGK